RASSPQGRKEVYSGGKPRPRTVRSSGTVPIAASSSPSTLGGRSWLLDSLRERCHQVSTFHVSPRALTTSCLQAEWIVRANPATKRFIDKKGNVGKTSC